MGIKIQTAKDIKLYLAEELQGVYPEQEIRSLYGIIVRHILGFAGLHQVYLSDQIVPVRHIGTIKNICMELKTGKPIQYIVGETDFYNCKIKVNAATLIPRHETEELVDMIIHENKGLEGRIIDFGTGSGCIAVALAVNLPGSTVAGTDISSGALRVAEENARLNNVSIDFIEDDIMDPDISRLGRARIIVSNPPYVRNSEKKLMNRNVLDFEPHIALFVEDSDPLIFYRAILGKAEGLLQPGGRIYFEINEALGQPLTLLVESFGYRETEVVADINGKDRIIKAIKNDTK